MPHSRPPTSHNAPESLYLKAKANAKLAPIERPPSVAADAPRTPSPEPNVDATATGASQGQTSPMSVLSMNSRELFALAQDRLRQEEATLGNTMLLQQLPQTLEHRAAKLGVKAFPARTSHLYDKPGTRGRGGAAVSAEEFNKAVAQLKEKVFQKGKANITTHFQALDADRSGVLELGEFREAIDLFNLGIRREVADSLMQTVDEDSSGTVDYNEFTDALRFGKIKYKEPKGPKKCGPDPDLPFGDPKPELGLPWGIMHDADRNLKAFDARINAKYRSLEDVFNQFDDDNSGHIDAHEFHNAMKSLKLELSDREIKNLFHNADTDASGSISYTEFVKSFQGGGGKRFIPEFLKPKIARRSQSGHPWSWLPEETCVGNF